MRAAEMRRNLREGSPRIAVGAALGLRSGSLASNGETSPRACSLRMWVSRRIEEFSCAKRVAATRTCIADTGFEADRYSREFAIHAWSWVCRISQTRNSTLHSISICAAGTNGDSQALPQGSVQ
jgi:hypothetical protein